jgi:hypothetical protein
MVGYAKEEEGKEKKKKEKKSRSQRNVLRMIWNG